MNIQRVAFGVVVGWALSMGSVALGQAKPTTLPSTRPAVKLLPTDRPAVKVGKDGKPDQGFLKRHESFLARGKAGPIGVLFLGDSITDWWSRAPQVWADHYGKDQPADFGIAGDRTEHVLWRIANGELDGIHPKVVVLMIGTNNVSDTPAHIQAGVQAIVNQIHAKLPESRLLLLAIFPRGSDYAKQATQALRSKLGQVNQGLAKLDDGSMTRYLDFGDKFLDDQKNIPRTMMKDGLHPTTQGYTVWADAMQPLLDEMMR